MGGKRDKAVPEMSKAALVQAVLGSMRREALRRRRRPILGAALWGQFHEWVRDESVEAVIIHGTSGVHILQSGAWREVQTPFVREQQVRELLRRLTLNPRRERHPVHVSLPEGFELFSWQAADRGATILFLRRLRPLPPAPAKLHELWRGKREVLRLVAGALSRRQPVLVCGPGQHAREQVLLALSGLLDTGKRAVWLVDAGRPLPLVGAAAVVSIDCQRLHADPLLARHVLQQLLALSPDWIVAQDAPSPLLAAVAEGLRSGRWGFMAAAAFPLQRSAPVRPERIAAATSQGIPEAFRWIVEVGGYRRPVIEGVWRALPGTGPARTWRRLQGSERTVALQPVRVRSARDPASRLVVSGSPSCNGRVPVRETEGSSRD
ncbi:MAG TPA: hypothetical protein VIK98_09100 [Limnochordales bacterium]